MINFWKICLKEGDRGARSLKCSKIKVLIEKFEIYIKNILKNTLNIIKLLI